MKTDTFTIEVCGIVDAQEAAASIALALKTAPAVGEFFQVALVRVAHCPSPVAADAHPAPEASSTANLPPFGYVAGEPADTYERQASRKARALPVLAPLGFVDNQCGISPGTVFHPQLGHVFDVSEAGTGVAFMRAVFQRGIEVGRDGVRESVRLALGIKP